MTPPEKVRSFAHDLHVGIAAGHGLQHVAVGAVEPAGDPGDRREAVARPGVGRAFKAGEIRPEAGAVLLVHPAAEHTGHRQRRDGQDDQKDRQPAQGLSASIHPSIILPAAPG